MSTSKMQIWFLASTSSTAALLQNQCIVTSLNHIKQPGLNILCAWTGLHSVPQGIEGVIMQFCACHTYDWGKRIAALIRAAQARVCVCVCYLQNKRKRLNVTQFVGLSRSVALFDLRGVKAPPSATRLFYILLIPVSRTESRLLYKTTVN